MPSLFLSGLGYVTTINHTKISISTSFSSLLMLKQNTHTVIYRDLFLTVLEARKSEMEGLISGGSLHAVVEGRRGRAHTWEPEGTELTFCCCHCTRA
jgi:hypothetical protein